MIFLLQGNATVLHPLESLKNNLYFTIWVMFWIICRIKLFFFSIQNIENNCYVVFLIFFPIIFIWWKISSFPVVLFMKGLIFVILCRYFSISSWLNATDTAHWKHLLPFLRWDLLLLLLLLLSNQENLYLIHHVLDLFYDIYDRMTEHNRRQSCCLSFIFNYFHIYFQVSQKVFL